MNKILRLITLAILSTSLLAPNISFAAKQPTACTLVSGTLVQKPHKPVFKFNAATKYSNNGYPMSHTQFYIQDGSGQLYKIVMDNLFYNYLSNAQATMNSDSGIEADFTRRFPAGSPVEACGKLYQRNNQLALHFVHPSGCEKTKFNGFLHINGVDIAANQEYCGNCGCKITYN
jgi:predicted Zn-dependent protease